MKALKLLSNPLSDQIKSEIQKRFESHLEKFLEDCVGQNEYEQYGDTYYHSGCFYSDRSVESCRENAKEELLSEFKKDPNEFFAGCEDDFDFAEVINFIKNIT